jgi:uncharacterized membrane protein YfcA
VTHDDVLFGYRLARSTSCASPSREALVLSTLDTAALVAAGVTAGLVGTAGGITSSVSYPVLLAVGLPALPANIANNIALVACWPGSALASQPELGGRGRWLWRWSLVAIAGGATGAALLLLTSDRAFAGSRRSSSRPDRSRCCSSRA